MKKVITGQNSRVGPWICQQLNLSWYEGKGETIGLEKDGELVAAALYESYSPNASCVVSLAGLGKNWLDREFLWYGFYYPFVTLNCKVLIGVVASSNLAARRFDEHIGFQLEATLKDADTNGDLLIYTMRKEQCRWLARKV